MNFNFIYKTMMLMLLLIIIMMMMMKMRNISCDKYLKMTKIEKFSN